MELITTPMLNAINQSYQKVQNDASRVAQGDMDALVEMKQSELRIAANAKAVEAADKMTGTLLDIQV